ncbi:MBG domain-containing protein [Geomesophilobacter sediminis]|uniref:LamG-like jellyroll fold domain-containing protein n=1 Tax=Geomesophilobacter sediminis TaxID=2798584 RepID=A0A8J7IKW4_9BACT|nr:MBG domain-containing protein [Geomesophilobacter sediminis]MBJ6723318.1 hypothetical protein [Geomesophilobacter sediminis]
MVQRWCLMALVVLLSLLPAPLFGAAVVDGFKPVIDEMRETPFAAAVQRDGKILVTAYNGFDGYGFLLRLNPDGTRDSTFTKLTTDWPLSGVLPLSDGRIMIYGSFSTVGGTPRSFLARLNADGTLDSTFDPSGLIDPGWGGIFGLAALPDGKFIAGGDFNDSSGPRNVVRLLADGSIDPQFLARTDSWLDTVVLQPDGKILVAGAFTMLDGVPRNYLGRLNADGTIDAAFAPDVDNEVSVLALEDDGSILISGFFTQVQGIPRGPFARLNQSGNVDQTFNVPIQDPYGNGFASIAVQPDGRIVVSGTFTGIGSTAIQKLARITRTGVVETGLAGPTETGTWLSCVILQSDGKIITVGSTRTPQYGLARYYPSGQPDADVSVTLNEVVTSGVYTQFLLPDEQMVIGGYLLKVDGTQRDRIAKLKPDWSLDPVFNPDLNSMMTSTIPLPDGRIVAAGMYWYINGPYPTGIQQHAIAIVDPNTGAMDPTFAPALLYSSAPVSTGVNTMALQRDGKLLVGGTFDQVNGETYINLVRMDLSGNIDHTFHPPTLDAAVYGINLLPDGKIIITGSFTGKIKRLNPDGSPDDDFNSRLPVIRYAPNDDAVPRGDPTPVFQLLMTADGKYIALGVFDDPFGGELGNALRLNADGSLDPTFRVGTDWWLYGGTLQADGKILLYGRFFTIRVNGVSYARSCVLRLNPDGTLDQDFVADAAGVGAQYPVVATINLQPDGKMLIGGNYSTINGAGNTYFTRMANGSSYDRLTVAPDGTEVRWMRSGSDAELWRVAVEESADGTNWSWIGDATRIAGGWSLSGLAFPSRHHHYIRAKGYTQVGDRTMQGTIYQPVRLYTVNRLPQTITFPEIPLKLPNAPDFDPGATASSGLPVTYLSSDPSIATIVNGMVHLMGVPGTAVITAMQDGNDTYEPAPNVSRVVATTKLDQTIHFALPPKNYGDADFNAGAIATSGLAVSYASSDPSVATVNAAGRIHILKAGSTTITASQGGSDVFDAAPPVPVLFTVAPAVLTVNVANATKTYGDANPAFSATYSGFVNGETAALISGAPTLGTVADPSSGVGSYPITAGLGALSAPNYSFAAANGTLTVTRKGLTVSAENASRAYGAANPSFAWHLDPAGLVNGDTTVVVSGVPVLSCAASGSSIAGNYPITIAAGTLSAANYSFNLVGATLTVTKVPLTVRANDASRSYGVANPGFSASYTGFVNGETQAVLSGAPSFTCSAGATSAIGGYPIGIAQGSLAAANYDFNAVPGTLTVSKATLTVRADDATRSYGGANPAFTASYTGFVNGESAAGVVSGTPVLSTAAVAASPPGTYPIDVALGTLTAANYGFTPAAGTLTVGRATLTVSADNKSRGYGGSNPPLTASYAGFVNGDTAAVLTGAPTLSTPATPASPAGSYPIVADASALSAANYSFTPVNGTLTVDKAVLTITADAKSRPYGGTNPTLTASYTGFLNGDTAAALSGAPLLSTGAAAATPPGSYPIAVAAGNLGAANYSFNLVGGSLTVTTAPLTIRADAKSRGAGTANPPLTATITGLVNGDTAAALGGAPALSTTADQNSPAGTYPISVAIGGINNPNYSYTLVDGILTVTTGEQTIDFPPLRAKTYGDGDFVPPATASSGLPVSFTSSDPTVAAVVNGKIRVVAPGTADITASQPGDAVWDAAQSVTRQLLVHPPPWNGLGFDGIDDTLRVADAPRLAFPAGTSFTIETWLHLDGPQPDGTGILAKGDGSAPLNGYQLVISRNRIGAEIGDGTASVGVPQGLLGTSPLDDGRWHQVALVVDRTAHTAQLYFDGRVEATADVTGLAGTIQNGAELKLGVDGTGQHFFKGELDETRIWSEPRSRDQIRAAGSQIVDPLDEPSLAGYFHFDEGGAGLANAAFATAPERTGNLAAGALANFALDGAASNWIVSGAFLPLLETAAISNLTATGLTSGATVYPNYYPPTDRGICWGLAANPDRSGNCLHAGDGVGSFTLDLAGLAPGTVYHVRGFATNVMGTAYGNDVPFTTKRLDQTTDFPPLPTKTYGDPDFPPGGTSTSGLPVTYTSSDPTVATVVGDGIHITGAGTTTITASQGGNGTYNPAGDIPRSFTVNKAPLTVRADDKTRAYRTANPALTATYTGFVLGEGMGAISGACTLQTDAAELSPVASYDIVTGLGSLTARNYTFILQNGRLNVIKSCQEIVFPPLQDRTYGDPPFQIVALACSGLNLTFASSSTNVVRINGNVITIVGAGSATVTASQTGSGDVTPAPDASQTIVVHKGGQQITFSTPGQKVMGDPPFPISATASSGLPITFRSLNPEVATVAGKVVTLTGVGTAVLTATQAGDGNYEPALAVSQPLTVVQEGVPPLVALSTLPFGAITASPVLNVEGLTADASGIERLTINDRDYTDQGALFSGAVPLTSGDNLVSVTARDGAGNRSTDSRTITYDASAPAIELSLPPDNGMTGNATFPIAGKVAPGTTAALVLNDTTLQPLAVDASGSFAASGTLVQGVNTIRVIATRDGQTSQVKRSVALVPGGPEISINDPGCDVRTEQPSVMLKGTASGTAPITLLLEVNGTSYHPAVTGGTFQQAIALDTAGEYRVKATVTDGNGSTGFARRNLIRADLILGDLNGDGLVDVADAALVLRMALGLAPVTDAARARADLAPVLDGVSKPDGNIDVGDVLVLLRKIVGLTGF